MSLGNSFSIPSGIAATGAFFEITNMDLEKKSEKP